MSASIATVALAGGESWDYAPPRMGRPAATVTRGLDGAGLLVRGGGWRKMMVGIIGPYDDR